MKQLIYLLPLTLLAFFAACSLATDSEVEGEPLPAPWDSGDSFGSMTTEYGETFVLDSSKSDFYSIVEDICNHFEISVVVQPVWLLDRGLTIKLEGTEAKEVLGQLAEKSGLELKESDEGGFTLMLPGHDSDASETVTMEDY